MAWVILGRVLRGEPGVAAAAVVLAAHAQQAAANMDLNAEPPEEPNCFTEPGALPPAGVTILAADGGAHPDANNRDRFPYIIAASRFCLLAHFAVAPFFGTDFGDNPENTHLVLVRHFHTAAGQITAKADQVPPRITRTTPHRPSLRNIQSVGLLSDDGLNTIIAELQVGRFGDGFDARILRCHNGRWTMKKMDSPLIFTGRRREWVPHGAVSFDTTICWFDLSWGMLACDFRQPKITVRSLRYQSLPEGHMLPEATPDIHTRRCITVTDSRLRYVEIAVPAAAAPTVSMWTLLIRGDAWGWVPNYTISFERIWDDDSYVETGLPRQVPVLAAVSPANPHVVYFALEQNIFGVNVAEARVEHWAPYNLVNVPAPQPPPASGRFLIPWTLPEAVAQALGYNALAAHVPGQ